MGPPKRRGTQSASADDSKRRKTGDSSDKEKSSPSSHRDHKHRNTEEIPEHEYICIHRPYFDYELEDQEREEPLEDELHEEFQKGSDVEKEKGISLSPATQHPECKWIIQWSGWKMYCDYQRRAGYCDQDAFGMYIYNDWQGWGIQELIENFIVDFNKEFSKKNDERALQQMWAVVSALGLWLNEDDIQGPWMQNEDGDKVNAQYSLVGCAVLTALNALDLAGELTAKSKFNDLGLVMSLFLNFACGMEDYGIEEEEFDWRERVAQYAKKAGVDPEKGVFGTKELLKKYDAAGRHVLPPKKDRWKWVQKLKEYKREHGTGAGNNIGGHRYDITKMSRQERAKAAFDKKDPLAGISAKDLKEGNLMVR